MRRVVIGMPLLLCMLWLTTAVAGASGEVPSSNESENITLTFEKEVQISPDGYYLTGGFCRINHVPQTDLFALTFGAVIGDTQTTTGMEGGTNYYYKEYTLDLDYNGNTDYVHHGGGDSASIMVEGYYYFLTGGPDGWVLKKIDPVTWQDIKEVKITIPLDSEGQGHYGLGDQMLAYANGYLDASALHVQETEPTDGSHHHLFTLDLEPVDEFLLHDTSHIDGSSMIFANGAYQFVTADQLFGQLIVMQYDSNWYYLGYKPLITNGLWSQGLLWDEELQKYFVAYVFRESAALCACNNIHLAIFDRDWNLVDDIAVTEFAKDSLTSGGRPWVIRHNDKFYVSYDVDTSTPTCESNHDWKGYVKVYGLSYSIGCSTWSDVISEYNKYVSSLATWTDVITCYTSYTSH
ncbi:MAG: hypothetical protein NT096_08705 [Proteobacteria bacterium]|nr:hypothetical protein [Pseudomonadota bacterium]